MKILVTGSEGFIGTRTVAALRQVGHDVRGVDSLEPRVHGKDPTSASDTLFVGDVSNTKWQWLAWADVVIHLAAQVGVADSMTDPLRYVIHNTMQTTQFLDRLAHERWGVTQPFQRLIVASSMSVYGDPATTNPIGEDHPVRPASVYGLTKYDQEMLCRFWGQQQQIPVTALRFFNVYGPGQCLTNPYTGVLANFAQRLLQDQSPTVYEDGQQTRDFIYVDDVVRAIVHALTVPEGVYNVCTGRATTIEQAACELSLALGKDIPPMLTGEKRLGDIRHCVGNPAKLGATGWQPMYDFTRGIRRYAGSLI